MADTRGVSVLDVDIARSVTAWLLSGEFGTPRRRIIRFANRIMRAIAGNEGLAPPFTMVHLYMCGRMQSEEALRRPLDACIGDGGFSVHRALARRETVGRAVVRRRVSSRVYSDGTVAWGGHVPGSPSFVLWSVARDGQSWLFVMWIANAESRRLWQRLMDDRATGSLLDIFDWFEGVAGLLRTTVTQAYSQSVGMLSWGSIVRMFEPDAHVVLASQELAWAAYTSMVDSRMEFVGLDKFCAWRLRGGDLFWVFCCRSDVLLIRTGADGGVRRKRVAYNDPVVFENWRVHSESP